MGPIVRGSHYGWWRTNNSVNIERHLKCSDSGENYKNIKKKTTNQFHHEEDESQILKEQKEFDTRNEDSSDSLVSSEVELHQNQNHWDYVPITEKMQQFEEINVEPHQKKHTNA